MDNSSLFDFNFENTKSEFIIDWLNILCDTEVRLNKFKENFFDTHNIFHSACRYQRYLRKEEKRGQDIQIHNIQQAVKSKDLEKLKETLQEMFIEPIDKEAVKYFLSIAEERRMFINELVNLHNLDEERSFWLILKKIM